MNSKVQHQNEIISGFFLVELPLCYASANLEMFSKYNNEYLKVFIHCCSFKTRDIPKPKNGEKKFSYPNKGKLHDVVRYYFRCETRYIKGNAICTVAYNDGKGKMIEPWYGLIVVAY
uniref:Uncharacterized protein n=1 Tax=Ditylum brightwellii TaxID=49249 RepID=A0A6V2P150_9STRA